MRNKITIEKSLLNLAKDKALIDDEYTRMKKTAQRFLEVARKAVEAKFGFGTSLEYMGSTKLRLGVRYEDKGFDVDSLLIFNTTDITTLVEIKKLLISKFRDFAGENYENAITKNKKPVIEVAFKDADGADKFHLDFLIVGQNSDGERYFVYSDNPLDFDTYKLVETKAKEMYEKFEEEMDYFEKLKPAIITLKWWNWYVTQQATKNVKLPSSYITETLSNTGNVSIVDMHLSALNKFLIDLESNVDPVSEFEPKWGYFRKMTSSEKAEARQNVKNFIRDYRAALDSISVEDAIKILKKYFKNIEISKVEEESVAVGRRAG